MREWFRTAAHAIADVTGSAWAFLAAAGLVIGWALSGPLFGFSETWQLFINTTTTIVTFLMVFLLQNSQDRDTQAIHIKLNELIRANDLARDRAAVAEAMPAEEVQAWLAESRQGQKTTE